MKAAFESLTASLHQSFFVRKFEDKQFPSPYHFHPEYELTLILSGIGKRYVGSHMDNFGPGDLVFLGPNLPHCWKTEETAEQELSTSIVIQFKEDCMGEDFFKKPELSQIAELLKKSVHGLQFTAGTLNLQSELIALHQESNSLQRLLLLLGILQQLASSSHYLLLDKQAANTSLSAVEKERIIAAIAYIVDNFQQQVCLKEAAQRANMTPNAFCKYFKKISRKTFMEAVNDYRIDYAIRQLVHTNKSIAEIGFESGFNDISNFHRTFKERLKTSPLSYRNKFCLVLKHPAKNLFQ